MKKSTSRLHLPIYIIFTFLTGSSYSSLADNVGYDAICSYYSQYQPCAVELTTNKIKANLPTDFLLVDKNNFIDLIVYEDLHNSSNLIIGTATSIILGPIGLLGFLATKKSGTVDYAIKFRNTDNRPRTALIRFKNLRVARKFGEDISSLLPRLSGE
jgi:hypothetical protein